MDIDNSHGQYVKTKTVNQPPIVPDMSLENYISARMGFIFGFTTLKMLGMLGGNEVNGYDVRMFWFG